MATGTTNLTTFINSNADLLKTMIDNSDYTKDLVIPDNITSIVNYAFFNRTGFKGKLLLPNGLLSIGSGSTDVRCFAGCTGFTGDLTLPNSLITIAGASNSFVAGAFYNCTGFNGTLTIGTRMSFVAQSVFSNCSGFKKLILPSNIAGIGIDAFRLCTGLTDVDCYRTTPPTIQSNSFNNVTAKFYVPADNIYAYKTATNWVAKATQICGRKDYIIDDTFENFAQGVYTTTTWYATKEDLVAGTNPIASGTTVGATGTYYCTLT